MFLEQGPLFVVCSIVLLANPVKHYKRCRSVLKYSGLIQISWNNNINMLQTLKKLNSF